MLNNIANVKFKFFAMGMLSEAYTIEDIATDKAVRDFWEGEKVQYIGKKDSNGEELYFGDVIKVKLPDQPHNVGRTFIAVVDFDESQAGYAINEARNGELDWNHHNFFDDLHVERLGSYLTNPELIKD